MITPVDHIKAAETAVAFAVCAVFDLDPNASSSADFVRFSYRGDGASPLPSRTKDLCYITVTQNDQPVFFSTNTENNVMTIRKTIPLSALVTFYGPACRANAEYFRTRLLAAPEYGSPRQVLSAHGIVPVIPIGMPVFAPEVEDANWRLRCDVRFSARQLVTETLNVTTVSQTPDVDTVIN